MAARLRPSAPRVGRQPPDGGRPASSRADRAGETRAPDILGAIQAVIALALELGLRRAEIFSLSVDAMRPDNAAVIVWRNGVEWSESRREVPYTVDARRAVGERCRREPCPGYDGWVA